MVPVRLRCRSSWTRKYRQYTAPLQCVDVGKLRQLGVFPVEWRVQHALVLLGAKQAERTVHIARAWEFSWPRFPEGGDNRRMAMAADHTRYAGVKQS